ncbi:MAG: hypothetical protein V4594_23310 [Bacteroidota bacterium]
MRTIYCAIILCFIISAVSAQHVAVINGKPLSSKEFMWFYKKNHAGNANASDKDLAAYLNLYIDFRLKVLDARELGMDQDTTYLAEVKEYESSLNAQKRVTKSKPEYTFMLNEYQDAVLMFNLTEQKIWSRSLNEETELRNFYGTHKNDYPEGSFDDVKLQVITDYQQSLENKWVAELRKKYTVKVNQDELRKLAKP